MTSLGLGALGTTAITPALAAGGSGAINLDLDWTFIPQMVVFVLLAIILKPLLFDPVLKMFEQRERLTEGARAEAREMQERAGEILEKYQAELARVHEFVAEERERIRTETAKLEAQLLAEARGSVNEILADGRRRLGDQIQAIRRELTDQSQGIAKGVAGQALGREVTG